MMAAPDIRDFRRSAETVLARQKPWNGVRARPAGPADIPALAELNARSIRDLGRDGLLMPMSEAFFVRTIAEGLALFLEGPDRALGYSLAVPAGGGLPAFLPAAFPGRIGLLFGTALDPAMRGRGWQAWLIDLRLEIFETAGFSEVQCTVSPFNTPSLVNLVDGGFRIADLKSLLDGHPRFIVRRGFDRRATPHHRPHRKRLAVSEDLAGHAALLGAGYVGAEIVRADPVVVLYAKCGSAAS